MRYAVPRPGIAHVLHMEHLLHCELYTVNMPQQPRLKAACFLLDDISRKLCIMLPALHVNGALPSSGRAGLPGIFSRFSHWRTTVRTGLGSDVLTPEKCDGR